VISTAKPNIILVGSGMWPWYQEVCTRALTKLGCRVERFSWLDDFYPWAPGHVEPVYKSSWARLQNRFLGMPWRWACRSLDRMASGLQSKE